MNIKVWWIFKQKQLFEKLIMICYRINHKDNDFSI